MVAACCVISVVVRIQVRENTVAAIHVVGA